MKKFCFLLMFVFTLGSLDAQTYPYAGSGCSDAADVWGFYKRQCVSYVAWCMNRDHGNAGTTGSFPFRNDMTGTGTDNTCSPSSGQRLSHACRWNDLLALNGYYVTHFPTPGAIAQWNGSEKTGIGALGHVEYVISVNSDGTANTQSYNAAGTCAYKAYSNRTAARYIRFSRMKLNDAKLSAFVKGQAVSVTASLTNNFGQAYNDVRIRAALYTASNAYVGVIEEKTLSFAANEEKSITFSKSTLTSSAGDYKIWIETQWGGSPWVLVHKPFETSTIPVSIVESSLTVTPTALAFDYFASSKTVSVVATGGDYTATSSATWLTLSKTGGTITVNCTANAGASRTATITVKQSSNLTKTVTVTVTQAAFVPSLTVTPSSLSFTSASESKTVGVESNAPTAISSNVSWLTVSPTSGGANTSMAVTARAVANTLFTSRTGLITVKQSQSNLSKTVTVTVTQAAAPNILDVSPTALTFNGVAGTKSISITASGTYTVTDDASWLSLSRSSGTGNGTMTATCTANPSTTAVRTAVITFKQNGLTKTIAASQNRKGYSPDAQAQSETDFALKSLYPNPVSDALSIVLNSNELQDVMLEIRTIDGKPVSVHKQALTVGENRVQIPVTALTNGFYFLAVFKEANATAQTLKFEVLK
ncbi:MAG: hypothetical protein RLZZ628_2311 [Bacteroidota bacterium]